MDASQNPQSPQNVNQSQIQFYTLQILKNVTTAAVAITLICGLIMNFYKNAMSKEISLIIINSIALALCIVVVLFNNIRRDSELNKGQEQPLLSNQPERWRLHQSSCSKACRQ
jgi:hypothetical protein